LLQQVSDLIKLLGPPELLPLAIRKTQVRQGELLTRLISACQVAPSPSTEPLSLEAALEQFIRAYKSAAEVDRPTKLRRILNSIPNEKRAILCGFGSLLVDPDTETDMHHDPPTAHQDPFLALQPLLSENLPPLTELADEFSLSDGFNYSDSSE